MLLCDLHLWRWYPGLTGVALTSCVGRNDLPSARRWSATSVSGIQEVVFERTMQSWEETSLSMLRAANMRNGTVTPYSSAGPALKTN